MTTGKAKRIGLQAEDAEGREDSGTGPVRQRLASDARAPEPLRELDERRFCIFVPCYNTSNLVEKTIGRVDWDALPPDLEYRVVFVENRSTDDTWDKIQACRRDLERSGIDVDAIQNPVNLSYGGSNKVIFDYCIKNDIGLIGILHSDGQYLPEELPRLVRELQARPDCALFYGSRLLGAPLKGGMPKYKFVANLFLTWLQNRALGSHYSEFHSGYRFYRMNKIRQLPYHDNSDYYYFDSHIMFQIHHSGETIEETAIPTFYGDEVSHINPWQCTWGIVSNALIYRLHKIRLVRVKRFSIS